MAETKKIKSIDLDYMLLIPTLILIGIGLVFVYSASSPLAAQKYNHPTFFFYRQLFFCVAGLFVMFITKKLPISIYAKLVYLILILSLILMILVFIPGIAHSANNASRWIKIGNISIQPAEFTKFAIITYLAYSLAKKGQNVEFFSKGIVPHITIAAIFALMLIKQPDLGSAVILVLLSIVLMFVAGVRLIYLGTFLILGITVFLWIVNKEGSHWANRIAAYLNPWDYPEGIGYQIIHSFLAFGSGGIFGTGLGNSTQKLFYLPEAHTDFIFSILAEEIGFLGVVAVIVLFGILIIRGIIIALEAKDTYSTYLALGISTLIGLQVSINLCVVMGLLPTKGLTLPLLSYGGSSLVMTLGLIGILMNISTQQRARRL